MNRPKHKPFAHKHRQSMSFGLVFVVTAVVMVGGLWYHQQAVDSQVLQRYPRLANYFLKTPITDAEAEALAQWDVVILGMQAQTVSPQQVRKIRQLNPDVILLAYVASQEFPGHYQQIEQSGGLWHQLREGIADEWWLYRPDGSHFSSWPGNWSLNVSNHSSQRNGHRWNTYLPEFMHEKVMSSGLWDGIFYDNVWDSAHWVADGVMDLDNNGQADSRDFINSSWRDGMSTLLAYSRELEGPDAIILGNGTSIYEQWMNGRLLENAYRDGWSADQRRYVDAMDNGIQPRVTVINRNTNNTESGKTNYQSVRYGLGSTLLQNGYFSYDFGDQRHAELWWYDEYDTDLGRPTAAPCQVQIVDRKATGCVTPATPTEGIWRRDFERGAVFVNSTNTQQTFLLDEEVLEKLHGQQDSTVNNGQRINFVRLSGSDGLLTIKPLTEIFDSTFTNGQFARIFNAAGQNVRSGFYTFKQQFAVADPVLVTDLDGDGDLETLTANDATVSIYGANGQLERTFYPYAESYTQGVNLAVGDLNGDGTREIITGTKNGGGPHIRIFNDRGDLINPGFFAYGEGYRGGVNVVVGDLNNDGSYEIIAGAGVGGGPHIRIFNKDGGLLSAGWFAYDEGFRGGVNVATGDVDGDGTDDIVSVPGLGGDATVKIWNGRGQQIGASWQAFTTASRDRIGIAVTDMDGDGIGEVIATSFTVL